MCLNLKPESIKKEIKITKKTLSIKPINYDETVDCYDIKLTHIDTSITVGGSGYNELDLMKELLYKLNDLVYVYEFNNQIPECNISIDTIELSKEINDNTKGSKK